MSRTLEVTEAKVPVAPVIIEEAAVGLILEVVADLIITTQDRVTPLEVVEMVTLKNRT